ncbi:hypothetical protein A9Q78_02570 [Methylophaga sp. 41_12_T18]|nr:hypothetical protein A9Q78_02570 [Methylophaga sp. 41_12_T18]
MDLLTHIIVGGCVAQIPSQSTTSDSTIKLSFYQRAIIGGIAALFPDIDYLLFLWDPLEFLAYWHRAETHSLLLVPIWAVLLTKLWTMSDRLKPFQPLIFWICLLAVTSHSLVDSLTVFGTQWFAPFSDYRISWNLLFIIDIYFTMLVILTLIGMYCWPHKKSVYLPLLLPMCYLLFVDQIKQTAYQELAINSSSPSATITLLPQPLSPFYWHVIKKDTQQISSAYFRLTDDPLAPILSELLGKQHYSNHFQSLPKLQWVNYVLLPEDSQLRADAKTVWHHQSFHAFRDFAVYPIFYQQNIRGGQSCIWFSDLRYHSPEFLPSFRYGMCSGAEKNWTVHSMKYLT